MMHFRFFRATIDSYTTLLHRRPILTKSLTTGIIGGAGDYVAQLIEWKAEDDPKPFKFDLHRAFIYSIFGAVFYTPPMHFAYNWLDRRIPGTNTVAVLKKIFIDQGLWAPPYFVYYIVGIGLLKADSWDHTMHKLKEDFWPALKANYVMWPLAQYFNFRFISGDYRIFYINVLCLGWNVYMASMIARVHALPAAEHARTAATDRDVPIHHTPTHIHTPTPTLTRAALPKHTAAVDVD
eukprot:TRINITY_DN19510_c0_g1::TRINITY_DN19510_c0_g1_i1::g.17150::m.17150 TRINITY_DN19510_c0_g1::TRINITY_DN19510_c0_g1_i1::g.17150  ORF type:complete len:237 (+),score=-6.63,sp/Q2KIY1/PXMP2_BOVIN/32.39/1e-29,Mpv17_PMP22/PF04117.7/1.1e-21 TRINITY_DN19510_c0_g1_i1:46-756(+)